MTQALFSSNNAGKLTSALYYTISAETLERELISDELIEEILRRSSDQEGKDWYFTFDDLQVEIIKKLEYKIEFIVSRDIPACDRSWQRPLSH